MRRLCVALVTFALVLALVPAAQAERVAGTPKKLWSEYPLEPKGRQAAPLPAEPKGRQAAPVPAEPLLPPAAGADAPVTDGQSNWILWVAVAVAGVFVLLAATRPFATSRGHVGRSVRALTARTQRLGAGARRARPALRMPTRPRRRVGPRQDRHRPPAVLQYAPVSLVMEPTPRESVPYVTRRSGLVRARYVVMVDEAGLTRELRRSRAFLQIGPESRQRRAAEDAWDALANDLRAEGWEVDATGRYEYFIPLRRAIVSTLEPYTRWERGNRAQS
jgi:hypothetical protein